MTREARRLQLENLMRTDPAELTREYYRVTGRIGLPAGTLLSTLIPKILEIEFPTGAAQPADEPRK